MTPSTKTRTSPRLPWQRKLLDDKQNNPMGKKTQQREFCWSWVLICFVKTRPYFFPKKGIEWYLPLLCWINKLTDSDIFLLNWHPDLMACHVIGSGSWSLDHFVLVKTCIPGDEKHVRTPAFAHPEKNVMFQKNKHRSETVWRETLQFYIHVWFCAAVNIVIFFQSADSFIPEDVSRNIPLAFGPRPYHSLLWPRPSKTMRIFSLVNHHSQLIVTVIGGLGAWDPLMKGIVT